jgi:hypothetical protein
VCEGKRPWDGAYGVYADEVDSSKRRSDMMKEGAH